MSFEHNIIHNLFDLFIASLYVTSIFVFFCEDLTNDYIVLTICKYFEPALDQITRFDFRYKQFANTIVSRRDYSSTNYANTHN